MRAHRVRVMAFLVAAAAQLHPGFGSEPEELELLSLQELLNVKTTVASGQSRASTVTETPGIVTVITRADIERWGARDLIDVLRMVPGFDIEHDIQGPMGLGIRGTWANEGKALILVDGIDLNDDLYQSFPYGMHIPTDIIERIEIIRGPGSAIYGGAAELGVVSITTTAASQPREGWVSLASRRMKDARGWSEISGYFGASRDTTRFSLNLRLGDGIRSDRTFTDLWGYSYDMADGDNASLESGFVDLGLSVGSWHHRFIWDHWRTTELYDYYGLYEALFDYYLYETHYDWQLSDELTLRPRVQLKDQQPWNYDNVVDADGTVYTFQIHSQKVTGELVLSYQRQALDLLVGYAYDHIAGDDDADGGNLGEVRDPATGEPVVDPDTGAVIGVNHVSYSNHALFGQAQLSGSLGNLTLGCRYERHSATGDNFVPRLAYTRQLDAFHVKVIATRAFRSPSILNIARNPDIEPEESTVLEVEGGVKLGSHSFLAVNLFNQDLEKPIVYSFDIDTQVNAYVNGGGVTTRGVELTFKSELAKGSLDASYSYSRVVDNQVELYAVPADDDRLLGFPSHKLTLAVTFDLADKLHLTPTLVAMSERWAISAEDPDSGEPVYREEDTATLANVNLLWRDIKGSGFDLSLAVYNALDEDFRFVQPYVGAEAPMPGASREVGLKATYHF